MKFERKELEKIVNFLKGAVSTSDSIPILKNICFEEGMVSAFDGGVGAIVFFDTQDLRGLLPFDKFSIFVKGKTSNEIEINFEDDEKVRLTCGRSKSFLSISNQEDFTDFGKVIDKFHSKKWKVPNLLPGFKVCLPFSSKKGGVVWNGIHLFDSFIEATDSKRIARYDMGETLFGGDAQIDSVVLSPEMVKMGLQLSSLDEVYFDKEISVFGEGDYLVFGNLLAGEYPATESFFHPAKKISFELAKRKTDNGKLVEFPKKELKECLSRVGDFSGDLVEQSKCKVTLGDTVLIQHEDSVAEITEIFDFGKRIPNKIFIVNPYHFAVMIDNCDIFSFQKNTLHGRSEDGRVECIVALYKVEDTDLPF